MKREEEEILAFGQFSCTDDTENNKKQSLVKSTLSWIRMHCFSHVEQNPTFEQTTKTTLNTEHATNEDDTIRCERHNGEKNKDNRFTDFFFPTSFVMCNSCVYSHRFYQMILHCLTASLPHVTSRNSKPKKKNKRSDCQVPFYLVSKFQNTHDNAMPKRAIEPSESKPMYFIYVCAKKWQRKRKVWHILIYINGCFQCFHMRYPLSVIASASNIHLTHTSHFSETLHIFHSN